MPRPLFSQLLNLRDPAIRALSVQARVENSVAMSVPPSTLWTMSYDTIDTNVGGAYSSGTPNRFTIPAAGFYLCGGSFGFDAGGTANWCQGFLVLNGTTNVARSMIRPTSYAAFSLATGLALTAGQVLQMQGYHNEPGNLNTSGVNFWLARVG